jgi:signal peptidase II
VCDTIRLSYAENAGAFLSLGEGLPRQARFWIFLLFPAMALSGLLVVALRHHLPGRLEVVALSLLVAGGMGNMVDRLLYGVVRDFLNVGIGSLRTGVFNVADVSIMVGATLLLLARFCAVRIQRTA